MTGVWEGGYNFFCQDTHSGGEADMKVTFSAGPAALLYLLKKTVPTGVSMLVLEGQSSSSALSQLGVFQLC